MFGVTAPLAEPLPGADPPGHGAAAVATPLAPSLALPPVGAALLAAAMALPLSFCLPGKAQAESPPERGLVSLKVLDYLDSQPGANRIRVRAPSVLVVAPINGDWSTSGTFVSDTISGASPAHHTSDLKQLTDLRRAGEADLTRYFTDGSLTLGVNYSTESDYVSRGASVRGTWSTADRNTTWSAGAGYNRDAISPGNRIVVNESKQVTQLLFGVTQVLGSHDIAQLNLGWTRGRGYYTDPYKFFDKRPRERDIGTVLARWNHHIEPLDGTLRTSWRYYQDNWDVRSHTVGVEYVQELPQGWTVTPLLRLYTQSAARFYNNAEPSTDPFSANPATQGKHYSGDQRLSGFGARTLGLKVAKQLNADWAADVKFEHYEQRGSWRVLGSGTPRLATFNFRSLQVGLSSAF